jgi:hypothetical protein
MEDDGAPTGRVVHVFVHTNQQTEKSGTTQKSPKPSDTLSEAFGRTVRSLRTFCSEASDKLSEM